MADDQGMSPADFRTAGYAAAITRHLIRDDIEAANAVLDQVYQEGLQGGLLRAMAALVDNYGDRLLGSRDAVQEDLTDLAVKMAAAGAASSPA